MSVHVRISMYMNVCMHTCPLLIIYQNSLLPVTITNKNSKATTGNFI